MWKYTVIVGIVALLAAGPASAEEPEALMGQVRAALEESHAYLGRAMERLGEVDERELRELSERLIHESGERLERAHHWTMETIEQLAHARREGMEEQGHREGTDGLGRTLRLVFEMPGGPVSILTATPEYEVQANRHEHESSNVEAVDQSEKRTEGSFAASGEIRAVDGGRFLVRFDGHAGLEEGGEEVAHRGGEASAASHGGEARFRGSVVLGVGEAKPIFTSPGLEILLRLEEG